MIDIYNKADAVLIRLLQNLTKLSRPIKIGILLAIDAMICTSSVWIAFSLRLGEWNLWNYPISIVMAACLVAWLPIFLLRGIYQSIVRFTGTRAMIKIATSCIIMAAILSLLFVLNSYPGVPRTIWIIHAIIFTILLILSRLVASYLLFDLLNQRRYDGKLSRVLIYGAGSAGRQLAGSLRHEPGMLLQGYIDDNAKLVGQRLDGVPIFHSNNLQDLIARLDVDTVLLAIPRLSRQLREAIIHKFENISIHILMLPAVANLVDGSLSIHDLRDIEATDLLGRDPVPPNYQLLHKTIAGQSILVTGAGGSIGSELCRNIVTLNPSIIVLMEMTEHALYAIESELREAQKAGSLDENLLIHTELGNVADARTVQRLFERWRPDTVFHAAAYKHVPLVEENVIAGMRNNIFGTLHCAQEAERVGVKHFILVSTDKAVRPTNVMGATKRTCELVLQALSARGSTTKFAMVRFGNVLGSSGSVVPRFQQQIRSGGPVTLTHRDVTRYFMTIPEAAQLVIQAGAMAEGGEVYVLDMGEPIRIYDLARTMIHLSGLAVRDASNPDGDIEIQEVGLRKGEKLYEELLIGNSPEKTSHQRIMRAREVFIDWPTLYDELGKLALALDQGDRVKALTLLSKLVPDFQGEQSLRFA